jgi:hypothetical protein
MTRAAGRLLREHLNERLSAAIGEGEVLRAD